MQLVTPRAVAMAVRIEMAYAKEYAEGNDGVKRLAYFSSVLLTDEHCKHRIGAYRKSHDKINEYAHQSHAAAHSCQCIIPCKTSHNSHVRRVEQLLQNTAESQRHCKQDKLSRKTAVKHVHFF